MIKEIKYFFRKIYYIPSATLNISARKNLSRVNSLLINLKEPSLLNLGGGERFIGKEKLEIEKLKIFVNFDIFRFKDVSVVGDAHKLPFKDEVFDCVVSQALLEHVENPLEVVKEIKRVLRTGGILYVEVPFIQGYHPSPEDFYRFTHKGLEKLLSCFSRIDSGVCVGPGSALSLILRGFITGLMSGFGRIKTLKPFALFLSSWLTFPLKYIDLLFSNCPESSFISAGTYFMGRKL